jgi:hypothetical protein
MLSRKRVRIGTALGLATLLVLTVAACTASGPTWVDSGSSYTTQTVSSVLAKADITKYADVSAADTTKLRHQALTDLRKRGSSAATAAGLITKTLPADSRGVPVYVERASVGGQPAYLFVEAIGPATGKLTTKRLWALSDAGAVIFVGTR